MKKQWNKDIRDQLKDFPKKAPEGLLDDIKSEMLRRSLSPVLTPRKKTYILLRAVSIASILLILLSISHFWKDQPIVHPNENIFPSSTEETMLPLFTEKNEQEDVSVTPILPKVTAKAQHTYVSLTDTLTSAHDNAPSGTKEEKNKKPHRPIQDNEQQATPAKKGQKKSFIRPRRKTSTFAFDAYYSGLVAQANIESNDKKPLIFDSPDLSSSSRPPIINEVKHHLPIKVGISFRYYLNNRWNIQSGLTYSYLATDINRSSYQKKQALHYIGIPIQIGYQLWGNKHFKSYLSAGAQVEKLVNGKTTTRYIGSNMLQGTTTESIRDKRLQFSALASIGAEYALTSKLSIYAEPGIHYYFDNGNGLETYYNDQPLNFNITVGFRFHWRR